MRWLLALVIIVSTGCRYTGAYTCERDDQCRSRAAAGTCQLPAGACSFPDATCPQGQRYDDTAGDSAGQCIEGVPMVDAATVFDPTTCPTGFMQLAATSPSRYRVLPALPATARFPDYMAACDAQLPGASHGAVIDTPAEVMAVAAVFGGGTARYYIGVVQDPAAATPSAGWIHANGAPVAAAHWRQDDPDDGNASEADHLEQAGVILNDGTFSDVAGNTALPVLCECDGAAPSAAFQAFLATNWN